MDKVKMSQIGLCCFSRPVRQALYGAAAVTFQIQPINLHVAALCYLLLRLVKKENNPPLSPIME
jgi:hypothetical protein